MSLAAGSRLGPYEIVAALGAGGMGEVYRARDTRLDRSIAVKVLPSHLASDPDFRARFDREARAIGALGHPNICVLHDVGHHSGTDFLVMESLKRRAQAWTLMANTTQPNGSRHYKYLGVITVLYVTMQLVCDATAGKLITLGGFAVSVTVLYFPLTYIFSDVLTEVYGYARARAVLWTVMFASILAGLTYQVAVYAPPAPGFDANEAYRRVFGIVPRVLVGAWIAIFAGDIANNYVMAKLKIFSRGKYLWFRIISSTVVGQFVNTLAFYVIGLYRIIPANLLFEAVLAGWLLKTGIEVVFTPVTYYVVGWLKRAENEDYYDHDTNFNPLIVSRPF